MRSTKTVAATVLVVVAASLTGFAGISPSQAAAGGPTVSAGISGTSGTVASGGTLYAKQGAALTLAVTTSNDVKCVDVGSFGTRQTSATAKSSWTFTGTAPAGDGVQAFTVNASVGFNSNGCNGQSATTQTAYTLDNTGPSVTGSVSPAANSNGWNNTGTTLSWAATDVGSGVASGPTPASSNESANGVVTRTSTATDQLGNTGSGTFTVRVDKSSPSISGSQVSNADGTTTVTFACSDSPSGIASCLADGTSGPSKTVTGPATVTGTATDLAGNTATASVSVAASDKTAPIITHAVTPAPNAAGWNKSDATVKFTCTDNIAISTCVADGTAPASSSATIATETNGTNVTGTAVDTSGNTATDSVTVKLDKTLPTISAAADRAANAAGWYNANVTVTFTCGDGRSGVKSCTGPATLGEGSGQSVSGTTVDNADNSASASKSGINVDKTPPSLSGTFTPGWHTGNVTVTWDCTDLLSGPSAQPAASVVTGEGSNLSASSSCADTAGNTATKSVSGIMIDRTAPLTTVAGASNSWTNGSVTLTLTATDNLSSVADTLFSIDGGPALSGTAPSLSTQGDHTVAFWSIDGAGNIEPATTVHVKIDKSAPTIEHSFPSPGGYTDSAWTNKDVQVHFSCTDQGGSGVASCLGDTTVATEGTSQPVQGTATDGAGNGATDLALVSIDKTAPTIHAAADRQPNGHGWYDGNVTVSFTCADDRSGVVKCPAAEILPEGQDQSASGSAKDNAGNSASDSVSGVNVDKTAPTLSGAFTPGWHNAAVTVTWTCHDALSGIIGPDHSIIGPDRVFTTTVTGEGDDLGDTASCVDAAGNSTTASVSGIKIDSTAPVTGITVSGAALHGWHAKAVSVHLSATDDRSQVAETFYVLDGGDPQEYTDAIAVSSDGTHTLSYWSVDAAGNGEEHQSETIKIDKTVPSLTGAPTTDSNDAGWYKGDVVVHWTCSDDTSGLDGTCPANSTVDGEGDDLSATASVSDLAGNTASATVGGLRIDRNPPTTLGSIPDVPASGWFTDGVKVTLDASDNLSQVATTFYTVDDGEPQVYDQPFIVTGEGEHSVSFHSVDNAGNVEVAPAALTFEIDTVKPTTGVLNPLVPASDWFVTSGIPFAFEAHDDMSGISATYYTIDSGSAQTYGRPFTKNLSDGSHEISYWSVDNAGNEEDHRTFDINLDTVKPTIVGSQWPAANGFGWNNGPVDVTFTCEDTGSGLQTGVAGCAGDTTLANETNGQSVIGDALDVAGNANHTTYGPVKIDTTPPTLTGTPSGANGAGWAKGNITVTWTGDDGRSGIDPATQPAPSPVTGEGRNLGASASITDKAGNTGQGSVSGLKIDRGAPTVTGHPTTSPNAAGWYSGNVVVNWTCADPKLADDSDGSGVASCPTSNTISGDGVDKSATSAKPLDIAGNEGAAGTVSGINIDGTAPSTTADNQCTKVNGWCTGTSANVVLSATDQVGLSGVKEIHYKVDSGAEQVANGSTTTVTVPLSGSGAGTVDYWAVDRAGNAEAPNKASLKWDSIAPTVTHTLSPAPNADEWNNANVTVTFAATDDDKGSGVASVSAPVTVSTETRGQLVSGTAQDTAGNVGSDSVTVKLDKTMPTISAIITAGTLGDNGWYKGQVTASFTCSDLLSGIAATACPSDVVLTGNGANNSATGSVLDRAGNEASASLSGIKIDQENPTLTPAGVNVAGGSYVLGTAPKPTCAASDGYSGLASCTVTVAGGTASGVGTFTWTATARDNAGNTTTITGTYQVIYRWDGVLQPINDTGHMVPGTQTSMFKAGSTIPVKFQLKNSAGQVVQPSSAPDWLTPVMGASTSAPVNETSYASLADSGSDYRYDATGQQWIYNWQTGKAAGNYWRIGVKFDDGQTYYVTIGLR